MAETAYRFSYSGADISNIAWFSIYDVNGTLHSSTPINLESLGTISLSVHESKAEVRSLGKRGVSGHTSSIRTIAGSMIFNVINNHPLYSLIEEYRRIYSKVGDWGWSRDIARAGFDLSTNTLDGQYMPTALPPFNLILIGITELDESVNGDLGTINRSNQGGRIDLFQRVARFVKLGLYGLELIDDGLVLSINNILSENTYTFRASDYAILDSVWAPISQSKDIQNRLLSGVERLMMTNPNQDITQEQLNQLSSLKGRVVIDRIDENTVTTSTPSTEVEDRKFFTTTAGGRRVHTVR